MKITIPAQEFVIAPVLTIVGVELGAWLGGDLKGGLFSIPTSLMMSFYLFIVSDLSNVRDRP